jgi:hypothetical protein
MQGGDVVTAEQGLGLGSWEQERWSGLCGEFSSHHHRRKIVVSTKVPFKFFRKYVKAIQTYP